MAIEFEGVSKRYGRAQALKEVSLRLEKERIYGLLGENGAGKSTLLNILGGRLPQSEGRVTVDGAPAGSDEAQGKVFIVGESDYFPEDMKVKKAFRAAGAFLPGFESEKAAALAGEFGLDMKKRVKALSTGYGSIFRLILGLCSGADYVAFDEPVLGLDARHRDLFYRLLMESYAARPHTVILSTHLIAEAANLLEEAVILHRGRVVACEPTENLRGALCSVSGPARLMEEFLRDKQVLSQRAVGGLRTACIQNDGKPLPPGLERSPLDLQEYFITLMEEKDKEDVG